MTTQSSSIHETQPSSHDDSPSPHWLTQEWLEPRMVVVTAIALGLSLLADRLEAPALLILILNITSYIAGGTFGAIGAITSLFKDRRIDVDMLMILAALGAAYVDSWHEGAMLLFLFSLSNVLQDYAIGRSRRAIKSLLKLHPNSATIRTAEGGKRTVNIQEIQIGDIVLIEPGERIPVDGVIASGRSSVDQATITGESVPVDKEIGDRVFAGTLNLQGALDVTATQSARDTMLARIIRMVEEAQDTKAPTERFLDKFEQYYALLILGSVGLFIVIPPALGWVEFSPNFYRAMVLMTVASPCALIISTPASFISAIASSARMGVLFKGSAYLEHLAGVKAIAFDKTGTLTTGKLSVNSIIPFDDSLTVDDLLSLTATAEDRSQHPLAKAIVKAAHERGLTVQKVDDFESVMGRGIEVQLGEDSLRVGNPSFVSEGTPPLSIVQSDTIKQLESEGQTVIALSKNNRWQGVIALSDQIRPEARQLIDTLHAQGVKVVMLTGDNESVARSIAHSANVDDVYAGLMPSAKADIINEVRKKYGVTAMVGDGVNDAPALAVADVGIAMGAAGTDVALETADIVLMGDRLELIPQAIGLSKKAKRVVWQNLSFSIAVIVMLIAGVFIIDLPLPLGVLGHEGSTVIVVLNGLIQLLILPTMKMNREARGAQPA